MEFKDVCEKFACCVKFMPPRLLREAIMLKWFERNGPFSGRRLIRPATPYFDE
jgi:hypothetical protein